MEPTAVDAALTAEQSAEIRRLQSLGYAGGTVPAPTDAGVTVHDSLRASDQLRYYTSGHAPEAYLLDATGRILHRWRLSYPDCVRLSGDRGRDFLPDDGDVTGCWRRARLLPGGDLLAIYEGHGLVKLDRASNLLWSYPGACHHDLDLAPDGSLYVLTRDARVVPGIHPEKPVLLDFVTHLSADGHELDKLDLYEAFANSDYASLLADVPAAGDLFHTNTLERFDGASSHLSPVFAEGNFLISLRTLNTIAVVDPRQRKVVWALKGMWLAQHQPTLLADGRLLLFDNRGHGGRSKVIEFDPWTQQVVWSYADAPGRALFSKTCGSAQRLPNGNTVISESDNGRVLEVTPDRTIVWEFRNPRRTGQDNEFIAAVMEMVYLPADRAAEWSTAP